MASSHHLDKSITRFAWKAGWTLALVVLAVLTVWNASQALLLLATGCLVAIFLNGIARSIQSQADALPYGVCLFLTILSLLSIALLATKILGEEVLKQTKLLIENIPNASELTGLLAQDPLGREVLQHVNGTLAKTDMALVQNMTMRALGWFSTGLGAMVSVLFVGFVGLYLASEPKLYRSGFVRLFSASRREKADAVLSRLGRRLRNWLKGQLSAMLILAVLTTLSLWLLGLPMYLALGLFTGVVAFVPYVGPIISVIPAALVGISHGGLATAGWVFVIYMGIQLLESYVITPLLHREFAHLPPVLTLMFQSVMGLFFGLLGLLLAAPATAVTMVLVDELWIKPIKGEK